MAYSNADKDSAEEVLALSPAVFRANDTAFGVAHPGARTSTELRPARMPSVSDGSSRSEYLVDNRTQGTRGNGAPLEDMSFSYVDENAADVSGMLAITVFTANDTAVGKNRSAACTNTDKQPADIPLMGEAPSPLDNLVDKSPHDTQANEQDPVEGIACSNVDEDIAEEVPAFPSTISKLNGSVARMGTDGHSACLSSTSGVPLPQNASGQTINHITQGHLEDDRYVFSMHPEHYFKAIVQQMRWHGL